MRSAAAKALVLFAIVAMIAAFIFGFNLLDMGAPTLSLAFFNLLWFAYSIGLFILAIIFRLGTRIQALAWGLVLIFQPLTAAFYPLSASLRRPRSRSTIPKADRRNGSSCCCTAAAADGKAARRSSRYLAPRAGTCMRPTCAGTVAQAESRALTT